MNPRRSVSTITIRAASGFDHYFDGGKDQLFLRYSSSRLHELDPLPIAGAGVPGFPVTDDISTNSVTISDVHLISSQTVETFRASFFSNVFLERPGRQSHARQQPRFRLPAHLGAQRGRSVSDRQRLRLAWKSDYRPAEHLSERLSGLLLHRHDPRPAQSQIRRRARPPADQCPLRYRHQRLLRVRSIPGQRFFRQFPAGPIRAVLPGRRPVRPRTSQVDRRRLCAGRVARHLAPDSELRSAL